MNRSTDRAVIVCSAEARRNIRNTPVKSQKRHLIASDAPNMNSLAISVITLKNNIVMETRKSPMARLRSKILPGSLRRRRLTKNVTIMKRFHRNEMMKKMRSTVATTGVP